MTLSEIEKLVRAEIADEVGTDAERFIKSWQIRTYANQAQNEACIRKRLLVDSSTDAVCGIQLAPGTSVYAYDPRIILILRGRVSGAENSLSKVSHTVLDESFPGWEDQTGTVEAFVTGMDKGKIRLFRKPTAVAALNMTVVRLPLVSLVSAQDVPEIPEYYHAALIFWIKAKVYGVQDSEIFDKNSETINMQLFADVFGQKPAAPYDVFDGMNIPQYIPDNKSVSDYDGSYF